MKAKQQSIELIDQHSRLFAGEVIHRLPGRVRYRVGILYQNPDFASRLTRRLAIEPRIRHASARWQTGTLIVEHELESEPDLALLDRWLQESLDRSEEPDEETADEGQRWLAMAKDELLQEFGIERKRGVPADDVEARRMKYGSNQVVTAQTTPRWETFKRQFANPQTSLLAGSAALSLLTGGMFDLVMIGGVLMTNAYIGFLSEAHAEEVIYSIGRIPPQEVQVLRGGIKQSIFDHELVCGDLVELGIGVVPADLRLIESKGLMVDESPLTGESMPVAKHHDPIDPAHIGFIGDYRNMLFRGTIITSGQGWGVVVATGEKSAIGNVRRLVANAIEPMSSLERDLTQIGQHTIAFSSLVCAGVFALGLWRGQRWLDMLKTSISLAVAAVPEGLPTIGTTTMAMGVSHLKKRNVLVRRLRVMETLGSIEVLCLDKTGTLTLNEMIADEGYFGLSPWSRDQWLERKNPLGKSDKLTLSSWSLVAALCNDCEWLPALNGDPARWSGSATEKSLIDLVSTVGDDPRKLRERYPRLRTSYRTESRQYMVTYHNRPDSLQILAAVKGSPEQLIEMCAWYLDQGEVKEISDELRGLFKDQNRVLGKKGLRVLGFAYLEGEGLRSVDDKPLIWIGLVGLLDPTREGMVELMEHFHRAGIKTIMMTGDQPSTAKAIGKKLGFNRDGGKIKTVDARALQNLSLDEIADLAEETQVFSRVNPSDKLRIVQALQNRGKIVAMAGDGINDSPALKAAHVGIAMGVQSSSAARESSDIVLRDDNLHVLFYAVQQGRAIHVNLRKSIKYLLATNLSEILLMFSSLALGRGSPLNPAQLLWINLLTDVLPGLALALDPPAADVMQRQPPDPQVSILPRAALLQLTNEALYMAASAFFAMEQQRKVDADSKKSMTAAFITLTSSQIFHALTASAGELGIINGGFPRNKRIYGAMGIAALTLGAGTVSPPFRNMLGMAALGEHEWRDALLKGIMPLVINELTTVLKVHSVPV